MPFPSVVDERPEAELHSDASMRMPIGNNRRLQSEHAPVPPTGSLRLNRLQTVLHT